MCVHVVWFVVSTKSDVVVVASSRHLAVANRLVPSIVLIARSSAVRPKKFRELEQRQQHLAQLAATPILPYIISQADRITGPRTSTPKSLPILYTHHKPCISCTPSRPKASASTRSRRLPKAKSQSPHTQLDSRRMTSTQDIG